jgi:hypothetical protein
MRPIEQIVRDFNAKTNAATGCRSPPIIILAIRMLRGWGPLGRLSSLVPRPPIPDQFHDIPVMELVGS